MKKAFLALRKVFFWTHLVAGVAAGLVILVMAVSGTLISFERQINEAMSGFKITVPPGGKKLEAEELLAKLKATAPDPAPSAVILRPEPDAPAAFQFGREKTLYVDPYTGEVLGEGAKKTKAFFQFMTGMHRWLALQGSGREVGQSITSAAGLVFFFIILTGLYLWIPKRWTRKGVKVITTFQGGLKGRARDWNWHNVLGIWFAVPLLILSATGAVIAYPWASALLYRMVGEEPPQRGGPGGGGGGGQGGGGPRAEGGPRGEGAPRGEGRQMAAGEGSAATSGEGRGASAEGSPEGGERRGREGRRRGREGGEGAEMATGEERGERPHREGVEGTEGLAAGGEGRPRRERPSEEGAAAGGEGSEGRGERPRREHSEELAAGGDGQPRGEGVEGRPRRERRTEGEGALAGGEQGGGGEGRPRREAQPGAEGGNAMAREGGAPRGEGGGGERRAGGGGGGRGPQTPAVWPVSTAGWNAAFAAAQAVSADWQTLQLQIPQGGAQQAVFTISDSHRGRPDLRQTVTIDLATTAITKVEKFESQSLGRRLRTWVRWVHTGEAGGWPGQLLAGLSTIAAVVLVWTGLALSWRRFFKKKPKPAKK